MNTVKIKPWMKRDPVNTEFQMKSQWKEPNDNLTCINLTPVYPNLTCINLTPVYTEHKSWFLGGFV